MSEQSETTEYPMLPAPVLPPTMTVLFGSLKRNGRYTVPPELQLKAAFGELRLDLREAIFPERQVLMVLESLCASVKVYLPEGVTVVDHGMTMMSSHKVNQTSEEHGPVIHLDGWSVCSDVEVLSGERQAAS